jgi:hypothetical protein
VGGSPANTWKGVLKAYESRMKTQKAFSRALSYNTHAAGSDISGLDFEVNLNSFDGRFDLSEPRSIA